MRNTGILLVSILTISLFVIGTVAESVGHASSPDDATPVASIDGHAITYGIIKVKTKAVRLRFIQEHGHDPETKQDFAEMEENRTSSEIKRLRSAMIGRVRDQLINELGIVVTEEETQSRFTEMAGDPAERQVKMERGRETERLLVYALDAVFENGEDSETVFDTMLEGRIPKSQWTNHLKYDSSKERRTILRKAYVERVFGDIDYLKFVRSILMREKLDAAVDTLICQVDNEYAEYIGLIKTNPRDPRVREKPRLYTTIKRAEWWSKKYDSCTVNVFVPRLDEARNLNKK